MFGRHKKNNFFSYDYFEARKKFLRLAKNNDCFISHFLCPKLGPMYKKIYTDVAYIGPQNAKKLIILISGTHGVEGFAGSAIQCQFLENFENQESSKTGVLLIHALNPYGFSWVRRVNEDNIDLNRNFLQNFSKAPENKLFAKLYSSLCPSNWYAKSRHFQDLKLLYFLKVYGKRKMQQAITQGQYTHPKGLFYGGTKASWSNQVLHIIINGYTKYAQEIVCIDIHTGLGKFGDKEIIAPYKKEDAQYLKCKHIFVNDNVTFPEENASSSAKLYGDVDQEIKYLLYDKKHIAFTLEFGTYPDDIVLEALRKENWAHFYCDKVSIQSKRIKKHFKEIFYPQNIEWQKLILKYGHETIHKCQNFLENKNI